MITSLLKWAYAMDVELWTENGKLKYRAVSGTMTEDFKQELIAAKNDLINRLIQNETAKLYEWTTFDHGEMYSKRTGDHSELFMFRNEDDSFTVWRASWKKGDSQPLSEKNIAENVPFEAALDRANNYYAWITNKTKRRKAS